ncbi:unnamed protein product [Bursaphelenchus okinawaensis]|uniref:Ubiquitin-related modifier 1 homolog n=1 Tax=Bursaphelenchus okinawaensis TaxID=465554 RepID=A0A811LP60_9BILA|nr:unnamed protein product [Bursaphelenchus okinawaensis]CAG9126970.1 unnamed protein product [Bursaphelenchus okinawaensis]
MPNLTIVFSGGSEALFGDKKQHDVTVDGDVTVKQVIQWIVDNLLEDKSRAPLFADKGTVRPGILVMVNDVDWEITGGPATELKDNDEVSFISTLHGG